MLRYAALQMYLNIVVIDHVQTSSSFQKLRSIFIRYCHELSCITTTFDDTKLLQNLESLVIKLCRSLETVFDLCGLKLSVEHGSEEVILGQRQSVKVHDRSQ